MTVIRWYGKQSNLRCKIKLLLCVRLSVNYACITMIETHEYHNWPALHKHASCAHVQLGDENS